MLTYFDVVSFSKHSVLSDHLSKTCCSRSAGLSQSRNEPFIDPSACRDVYFVTTDVVIAKLARVTLLLK